MIANRFDALPLPFKGRDHRQRRLEINDQGFVDKIVNMTVGNTDVFNIIQVDMKLARFEDLVIDDLIFFF